MYDDVTFFRSRSADLSLVHVRLASRIQRLRTARARRRPKQDEQDGQPARPPHTAHCGLLDLPQLAPNLGNVSGLKSGFFLFGNVFFTGVHEP